MSKSLEHSIFLDIYRTMFRIRSFENKLKELALAGKTPTPLLHLSVGQEACAVGVCSLLNKDDCIVSTHRGHGHAIAKGADLGILAAEILGKKTGYCKGKGGTMHIAIPKIGLIAALPIVGANLPIATGIGLALKLNKMNQIVVAFFGEGASNEGTFHESINLASIWNLPVVYFVENNMYGESTDFRTVMKVEHVSDRASAYKIPGESIDGNDVLAVRIAVTKAIERARRGEGPTLIEAKTYRWEGHFVGDPENLYRTSGELDEWKNNRDPIAKFEKHLLLADIASEADLAKIREEVRCEIEMAAKFALESEFAGIEEALTDVFAVAD
ncbi:MAG: thiamine pyrophosphate-dependent dehydrogenase E1 component subunit alpha [Nitrososphaerales archaeon]